MFDLESLVEKCLAQISEGEPVGENSSQDQLTNDIKLEIDKLTVGEGIDWEVVVNGCEKLLSERTKDLYLAGYLSLGLLMREGYKGLAAGLKIYYGILTEFNDAYYPRRDSDKKTEKVRRFAIEWLDMRLGDFLKGVAPKDDEIHYVSLSYDALEKIKADVSEKFRPPPSIDNVAGRVNHYKKKLEQDARPDENSVLSENNETEGERTKKEPLKEDAQSSATNKKQNLEQPDEPALNEAVFSDFINDPVNAIKTYASMLRKKNMADPVAYRLLRVAVWDSKKSAPAADANGKTRIPAHRPQVFKNIRDVFDASDPLLSISACEDAFGTHSFWWLDLQRAIVQAMGRAGDPFAVAAHAICFEALRLLERFPGLPASTYDDGTPFADGETLEWLGDMAQALGRNPESVSLNIGSAGDDAVFEDDLSKARELALKHDLDSALSILQKGIQRASDQKSIFCRRLFAGQLCFKHGQLEKAELILERLRKQTTVIQLKNWDPPLFLELYTTLEKIYHRMGGKDACDNIKKIQEEILHLNLGFALKSDKTGHP